MKSKLFLIVSFFLLISSSFISFKLVQSSHYQTVLMYDFNEGTNYFDSELYRNKIDEDFPNISLTALPIKYLLSRYKYGKDSISDVLEMLYSSIKANPYIKAPESMLARHFYLEKQLDSALYFAKDAFDGIPNNNTHRNIYFRILAELKDSIELDNAFMKIKKYNNAANWIDYIVYRNKINNKPDKRLLNVISDFRLTFPGQVDSRIENIQNFVEIGSTRYIKSIALSERAEIESLNGNFENEIALYEAAIKINNFQYIFYENAAIAYSNLELFAQAVNYFDKVIYEFKTDDGRAEFFKGLMLIKYEDNFNGCKYLKSSSEKNYIGNNSGIKSSDVYTSLCL